MPNLVLNPGFNGNLDNWNITNVSLADLNPYEGVASARLGPGVASLRQTVTLPSGTHSYQLSFAVEAPHSLLPGQLEVKVEWLDSNGNQAGIALAHVIPSLTLGAQFFWLTYVMSTETQPANISSARITFSKSTGLPIDKVPCSTDVIDLDLVVFGVLF